MANNAPKWKLTLAAQLICDGFSKRRAASVVGLSKQTVFTHLGHLSGICPCGQKGGHKGWCPETYLQSRKRQICLRSRKASPEGVPGLYKLRLCPKCERPVEKAIRHWGCWPEKPVRVKRVFKYNAMDKAFSLDSSRKDDFAPAELIAQTMFDDPLEQMIQSEAVKNVIYRLIETGMSQTDAYALVAQHVDI